MAAANPFVSADFGPPHRVVSSPLNTSVALNPNLFTNPFPVFNGDQSFSRPIPRWLPYPQDGINTNLFKNPYPFNQYDWSKPLRVPRAPFDLSVPLNPNIFTNPIPILNFHNPPAWTIRSRASPDAPYNQNLYTVTVAANPFFAAEIFLVRRPVASPLLDQPLNINLFTNPFPFNQYDWSKPYFPVIRPDPQVGLNINIFTNPYPFNQYDWSKPIKVSRAPFSPDQALNVNLFTNPIPVLNLDTPRSIPIFGRPNLDQPYNPNIYTVTVVVTLPFNQIDFPQVKKPPITVAPEQIFNPNLFTNPVPFNQFDYSVPRKVPQAPIDLSVPLNLQLFTNPIPFYNVDYTPQRKPLPAAPDVSQGFQVLYQPIGPLLVPAQYILRVDHYIKDVYIPVDTLVTEGKELPIGWIPTPAAEPINTPAIQAYWNAGPFGVSSAQYSLDFFNSPFWQFPKVKMKVYWVEVGGQPGYFQLTGAGASLGAKRSG